MSEIRFLTSSDEHVADISPGYRKDNYRDSILTKLEWQGHLAKKYNSTAILRGGDLFHVKPANKTTMRTVAEVGRIHHSYHCPTYLVPGNHDITHNDVTSIPGQPLGVLFATKSIQNLRDSTFESGSMKVRVVGVEYTVDMNDGALREMVTKKDENYTIAVVHALAAMAPEEKIQSFFNEKIFDYRDLVFPGCPDAYIFGHYHKDQGIVDHMGVKFVNLGAVSRGALTFENLERKPKVSLIKVNSSGISIEEVNIPCADASEIFDLDKKSRIDRQRKNLTEFTEMLKISHSVTDKNDISHFRSELNKFPDDIKSLANDILHLAESGVNE